MPMINATRHNAYYCSPRCQMRYQRVIEMNPPESTGTTVQDTQLSTSSSRKRQWVDEEELDDSPAQFRRVRLRHIPIQYTQNGSPNPQMSPDGRPSTQSLHHLAQKDQHQLRQEYMASLQRQQQAQMQNGNIGHGMPNEGSPTQKQKQLLALIEMFYIHAMRELAQRHANPAAITPQESQTAKANAIQRGTAHFKQQQNLMWQQRE